MKRLMARTGFSLYSILGVVMAPICFAQANQTVGAVRRGEVRQQTVHDGAVGAAEDRVHEQRGGGNTPGPTDPYGQAGWEHLGCQGPNQHQEHVVTRNSTLQDGVADRYICGTASSSSPSRIRVRSDVARRVCSTADQPGLRRGTRAAGGLRR